MFSILIIYLNLLNSPLPPPPPCLPLLPLTPSLPPSLLLQRWQVRCSQDLHWAGDGRKTGKSQTFHGQLLPHASCVIVHSPSHSLMNTYACIVCELKTWRNKQSVKMLLTKLSIYNFPVILCVICLCAGRVWSHWVWDAQELCHVRSGP